MRGKICVTIGLTYGNLSFVKRRDVAIALSRCLKDQLLESLGDGVMLF